MKGNLLGMFLLFKYCICENVRSLDGDIKNFVVSNNSLFVLTNHRLHQMRHDLTMEKIKDYIGTQANPVTLLVPFQANGTLITCGPSDGGYCEVLDLNDIANSIYLESRSSLSEQNEKSVAFIVDTSKSGAYILVGMKEDSGNPPFCIVTLWNTLHSQKGSIFSKIGASSSPCIQIDTREVEFIDGFQITSRRLSYLFLNAKTETGWQAYVLRLNNAKAQKQDIIKGFKGSRLECCKDAARPVLLASALIPSDKAVLWTGVFSAQKKSDPENTALAVYDISNVDGKVKGIRSDSDSSVSSEELQSEERIQPLEVVFKYKSMSSVTAVRDGSWIVLFIGTEDGQLIKLVLDDRFNPGCPTVLYRSDVDQEVFPKMHLDPVDFKYIYIAVMNQEPEILSIQPNKVSFHGRNNVLLKGRNLESITKIRIQGFPDCIAKESPVFDQSSDSLRFHIPPSVSKDAAKVCAVTVDGRCHGDSIVTYSSLPSCTGIQPKVNWKSGGRKIHVRGTNMEVVESIVVRQSNKELKTQFNTNTGDIWFHTHPYEGNNLVHLMLKVGNSTLDCADLTYQADPVFIGFTTTQIGNDILVILKKNADTLNLSTDEVKVSGLQEDQEYECVLESIASLAIMCKIKAVIHVDSLTTMKGDTLSVWCYQEGRCPSGNTSIVAGSQKSISGEKK
ncbi:Plexin-C1 Virus-encoded semaphorin protein receptor [Triplophysa tibetana]|uniref:Plexin-C1 Virus-encoded semaphorin protein receptor n=1 Tax=Triplophysa tibetana TaxID=1572043 RepID=A0A5A9PJ97_9TELE|nr:Plexin-C1 Virus-encoded semaphorin protein receptor [Triplophysa tibetana]